MLLSLLVATCVVVLTSAERESLQWFPESELLPESGLLPESELLPESGLLPESDMLPESGLMPESTPLPESDPLRESYPLTELEHAWGAFKINYGKNYTGQSEEMARKKIFAENLKSIKENNDLYKKGLKTFTMDVNEFADLDDSEFMNLIGDFVAPEDGSEVTAVPPDIGNLTYPYSWDWRNYGYVTRVKNQGSCASGWAFSATGALEGQYFKRTRRLIPLSEQQLIDCAYSNYGCYGGWPEQAFAYIIKNHGIDTESYYSYRARDGCCRYQCSYRGALCRSYVRYYGLSEYTLQGQLYHVGPLSVAIDASQRSFRFYRSGVYYEPHCKSALAQLNHKVLLVGYGVYGGRAYWAVKNSFGTSWGMSGYIWMQRNHYNNCGIASYMAYPVV